MLQTGFGFGVEALKSVILTLCCVERHISVERAVLLSRLEEEFQVKHMKLNCNVILEKSGSGTVACLVSMTLCCS